MANSSARAVVDVGSVIADTYTIEGLVGRGGMGTVFLASHNRLPGKVVAIKLLHTDLEDEEILARFRREALIASQLNHPNIVAVHDFNVMADGAPYLVLEFLHGESLASRIDHGGAMPMDSVFAILRQVGSAMAAAHQHGIVHRDLKPQNIFLVPVEADGGVVEVAKVLDFGISKIRGSSTVKTQESSLLGTPQYMAPEQATGQHAHIDERTDVFALGAIAYEMVTGKPAFAGASIPEVVFKVVYEQPPALLELAPATPPHVVDAIARAMAKASADRFATVSAFVEAMTGAPIAARPSMAAVPSGDAGTGMGSRIRPPSSGRGKIGVGVGRSGGAPITGGGKPASAFDPLANTVGSGQHGDAATMLPPPSVRRDATPIGETVGTMRGVAAPAPPPVVTPVNRRVPGALIGGLVAAGLVVISVCIFLVVRGGGEQGTAQPVALAAPVDAAVRVDSLAADAPLPPPADAAMAAPVDAGVLDAPRAKPDDRRGSAGASSAVAVLTEDEKVAKERVQRAEAALARNTPESNGEAQRLANAVADSEAKRFHPRALAVQGVLKCRGNLAIEARALLARLRDPVARANLVRGCKQAGETL